MASLVQNVIGSQIFAWLCLALEGGVTRSVPAEMRQVFVQRYLARRTLCPFHRAKKVLGSDKPAKQNVRPAEAPAPVPCKQLQRGSGRRKTAPSKKAPGGTMTQPDLCIPSLDQMQARSSTGQCTSCRGVLEHLQTI